MRYAKNETAIAPAVLPPGGTVTVRALHQDSNTLLALSTDQAVETVLPGVWQFPLSNITTQISGFAQLVFEFTHSPSGQKDYVKMAVRGVYDEITKTRKLVAALL